MKKISNLSKEEWVEQNLQLNPTVTKEDLEAFYDACEKYGVEISDKPIPASEQVNPYDSGIEL